MRGLLMALLLLLSCTGTCSAYGAEATYYCLDGITASGTVPVEGRTVACDDLPLGTEILIDGQYFVVEDRIGSGECGHVDIYAEDEDWCWDMGIREVEIEILA